MYFCCAVVRLKENSLSLVLPLIIYPDIRYTARTLHINNQIYTSWISMRLKLYTDQCPLEDELVYNIGQLQSTCSEYLDRITQA